MEEVVDTYLSKGTVDISVYKLERKIHRSSIFSCIADLLFAQAKLMVKSTQSKYVVS